MELSSNIERLRPSATIAVSSLARQLRAEGRDVLDLSAGEPDFPTPGWIVDAAVEGIRGGGTRYTPASGLPELREAVAAHLGEGAREGWEPAAEQVVITCGAKQALFNACFSLFGPGDEVLVASPYWTSYPQIVSLARAEPVFVKGPEERGFKLSPDDLERAATGSTRGLVICSPSNPTGAVYSAEELDAVARWARDRNVVLISDEIYRWICFEGAAGARAGGDMADSSTAARGSPATTDRRGEPGLNRAAGLLDLEPSSVGRYVIIDGVSKSHAMTGWRIGYALSDPEVARALAALQSHSTSNAATPSQLAALAALTQGERARASIRGMVSAFRRRRDLVVSRIEDRLSHLSFIRPEGAFYVFLRVDAEYGDGLVGSQVWCSRTLAETGVAMVPGVAFGDDRFARLSYATSDEILEEAIARLAGRRGVGFGRRG